MLRTCKTESTNVNTNNYNSVLLKYSQAIYKIKVKYRTKSN